MSWQLQEAKQRLSELVRRAERDGPQTVTRHGRPAVVVISAKDYQSITDTQDFKEFLRAAPDLVGLDIQRDSRPARTVDL
ncbi:hypothetical protein BH24ACT15_BH24ACT15_25460 [soil metagenome]